MTLVISKGITLRKGWQPMDPDAAAYITAVEAADAAAGQTGGLEERTKIAIDNFVLGCKADGIWNAIKASCIMAGARTRLGAMVPLVGAAPTSFNFVDDDYNRKTGLVGDGSTKYLNANRNNNADPQDSKHLMVFQTTGNSSTSVNRQSLGSININGGSVLRYSTTSRVSRSNSSGQVNIADLAFVYGAWGVNRNSSVEITLLYGGSSSLVANSSVAPTSSDIFVFAHPAASATTFSDGRLAFYSIGESLNLTQLDARVTDLINAFGAAIP
jgi:hypothetical protein